MSDEQRRVLDLLAQGKITADAADALLRALGAKPADSSAEKNAAPPIEKPGARYLKIEVHKPATGNREEKNVNIRVPIGLVRGGMRLGTLIGFYANDKVQQRLRERGIDFDLSTLDKADLDDILNNMGEMTVNVDKGTSQVRITCE
jgi:hypothetical protein